MDLDMQRPEGATQPSQEVNTLLERLLDEVETESGGTAPPPSAAPAVTPVSASISQSGGNGLGALLTNPALLTALPTLAENLAPLLGSLSGSLSRSAGSAPSATRPHTVDRHTALLCAVKPYLSPRRQEAAETVIRLCRVWDALERSGISLSGLLSGLDKVTFPTAQAAPAGGDKEAT